MIPVMFIWGKGVVKITNQSSWEGLRSCERQTISESPQNTGVTAVLLLPTVYKTYSAFQKL